MNKKPSYIEIIYEEAHNVFAPFSQEPWAVFLDSADSEHQRDDTNRYSYIAVAPFKKIIIKDGKDLITAETVTAPFEYVNHILSQYPMQHDPKLPPFQGGAIGYFSYDLCHYLEKINKPSEPNTVYADLSVGFYDVIISFDHVLKKAWIVSAGYTNKSSELIDYYISQINTKPLEMTTADEETLKDVDLKSPFNKEAYVALVKKAQDYILDGDIFEVNLSHRFQAKLSSPLKNGYALYLKIRQQNQSPFSAFLNLDGYQMLSNSPERFLLLDPSRGVSTRPIKGTAPRGTTAEEDAIIANALATSEKDRSENIMVTDLLRNDLSKVCTSDSVQVKKLCGLESYPAVHHLVTVVEGQLREEVTALGLLKACFPGGSITGVPKVRAMQIIYELEPAARGPYCGSIGYIGFNGTMDTSIIIRTLLSNGDIISYQAGGAIVLNSSPKGEYEETLIKSASIRKVIGRSQM